jgi:hypothetical protein
MADGSYHWVHRAMDADIYDPAPDAYDPMRCPLAYYACFYCRELFAYPCDESPIRGMCGYDGCNAALLIQAMDAEMQTDDLLSARSPRTPRRARVEANHAHRLRIQLRDCLAPVHRERTVWRVFAHRQRLQLLNRWCL